MKKIVTVVFGITFLVLGLTACGGDDAESVVMDKAEKETLKLMDEVYDSYETKSSSRPASNNGKYVYDSSDGTLTVTISGSSWRGKTVIKTGFGSAYDNQQAQYSRGIVNGNDLYDESGYIKVGYVSGNRVSMDGYSLYKN